MYDRAMLAVESIKDDYHFHIAWYNETMREKVVWNRLISGELSAALEDNLIRPWLQPIVDREGKTVGAEALVRWVHPDEGLRSPYSFIPVFEKNGMIAEVDRYIWRKSCEILARWKRQGKDLFISVNISPSDFHLMNVPSELMKLTLEYGIDPEKLRLEITETVMMNEQESRLDTLRKLQDAGFVIEMDDFGSGYSSLNLLREMPVDVLKIDMMFLRQAEKNMRARTIIGEIITMAGKLGITSLTEGVETKEQFESLKEMGCQMYQGYYFARPMPVEKFEKQLSEG
jgi:EAL domain-containing protein (putative c-di-GMP-specific phosphodiesterase class I)